MTAGGVQHNVVAGVSKAASLSTIDTYPDARNAAKLNSSAEVLELWRNAQASQKAAATWLRCC
jgi:hypothetical protein